MLMFANRNLNFSVNSLEFAQVAVISKSQEQIESLQIQDPFAKIPKELRTLR